MSDPDAKAIVRRFFDEAWNQKQVKRLEEYISAENVHMAFPQMDYMDLSRCAG